MWLSLYSCFDTMMQEGVRLQMFPLIVYDNWTTVKFYDDEMARVALNYLAVRRLTEHSVMIVSGGYMIQKKEGSLPCE